MGESLTKDIEIKNQHEHPIRYKVISEGNKDFSYEISEFEIEPKKTVRFVVKFTSRISKEVRGKIIFTNNKAAGAVAAEVIAFSLVSKITGRIPIKPYI